MKIRQFHVAGLYGATPEGGWDQELDPDDCVHTLLAITTDEGVTGYGSAFTNVDLVKASLQVLQPLVLGEEALEPERVSEKLHQHTFWLGRGGAITHTISAIDIALWDILGKATRQPVGRLLGGRYRSRVKPYASILMDRPEPLSERLSALLDQGFRAVKLGWGPFGRHSDRLDEQIVAAAREAVGDDVELMIDAGGSDGYWSHGYTWALRTADMLAGYGIVWFEEALKPDAIEDHVRLREHSRVPIAGGEVLTRRQAFTPWLQGRALDIVQPDVTKVGGISEQRRITWLAQENGIKMIPHGWNTAVGLAADLQLASAFADTDRVEYLAGSPYIDDISARAWDLDADGMLAIPEEPGLGFELDHDALVRFTRGERLPG